MKKNKKKIKETVKMGWSSKGQYKHRTKRNPVRNHADLLHGERPEL
jgi:hypothetical protein